ncbi:AAA family ATPase [Ralstonia pseudosolanacearum]|uniref:AAA family ATPase n=1 Tax=Ralstonia pseudosolanacearum TaxID=1310165 RepID=UPI0026FF9E83|nr:AAA family ATPase [Ralstonia pseudosolanacearum]MDO3617945.1 AAA family ATPase [Ralstonia pseudosolanacearum]
MSTPRKPSEHPPGFIPLGELSVLRSPASWQLLIPSTTHTALHAGEDAKVDLGEIKKDERESSSAEPPTVVAAEVEPVRRRARARHIQVFGHEALERANADVLTADRHQQQYAKVLLEKAGTNDGYRALPRIRPALKKLENAHSLFGNLSEPIQKLKIDLTLAGAMRAKDFRIRPILLAGEPGIGKTLFALKLAGVLGVPMRKWSAGSAQASFQLTGGDSAFRSARPGLILEMLAKGSSATPILVLDEVDKIGADVRYPVTPVLLDLLEAETARTFQDTFLRMAFDASRIICVLTANDLDAVPPALLSRVDVFDIRAPEPEQRLEIILAETQRLRRATGRRIEMDIQAAEALAERSDLDLRKTHRLVQDAFATAMASGKLIAVPMMPKRVGAQSIGFVSGRRSDAGN